MEVLDALNLGEFAQYFSKIAMFPIFDLAYYIVSILYLKYEPGKLDRFISFCGFFSKTHETQRNLCPSDTCLACNILPIYHPMSALNIPLSLRHVLILEQGCVITLKICALFTYPQLYFSPHFTLKAVLSTPLLEI